MNATIQICIKSVFGRETIYPLCEQAKRLARLVGTKTLTQDTLQRAIEMGFRVQQVF